jgi:hypothetical protein
VLPFFVAFHTAEASAMLMHFRPSSTLSTNLTASGFVEPALVVHPHNDVISAVLWAESFESDKPTPMRASRQLGGGKSCS